MRNEKPTRYLSNDWQRIVIETDTDNPEIVAVITRDDIETFHNFRIRLKPSYD